MKTLAAFRTLFAAATLLSAATLPAVALPGAAAPEAPAAATSAPGTVSGRLFDGQSQEPIPHAYVVVVRAADGRFIKSGETDAQGWFRVTGLPLGSYSVRTTVLGYHALNPVVALRAARPGHSLGTVVMVPLNMPVATRAAGRPGPGAVPR